MSMYTSSVPVAIHFLGNLSKILEKAQAFCEEKKIEPTVLTSARLAPDMFTLARQVQIACDVAKGCGARLSDTEAPKHEDTETTFEELQARIQKTIAFLETLSADSIDGTEAKEIQSRPVPTSWNSQALISLTSGRCLICISTLLLPTAFCVTTAWKWARWITWVN